MPLAAMLSQGAPGCYTIASRPTARPEGGTMQLAIFSSTSEAGFAPGWTEEAAIALFGSTTPDLPLPPPTSDAALTVAAVFGSAKVIVPPGARVTTKGI